MPVGTEVIQSFKNNDERIIKLHLFDDSLNAHGWGIDRELAASLANDFVNAPYIIPPDLNHPVRPYAPLTDPQSDISDIQNYAKPFEAGVCFKTEPCVSSHSQVGFDGYVKLTNQAAIEAFDRGLIPRYASIAFYNLDPANNTGYIKKGKALNICAVGKPAYSNAQLLGNCRGDQTGCSTNLKNAGVHDNSNNTSNYCILKTLESANIETINTSLNRQSEFQASLDQMSSNQTNNLSQPQTATNLVNPNTPPQQQQPLAPNQVQQPQIPQQTPGTNLQQQLQPQIDELKTPEERQLDAINAEIDEIANTKLEFEKLKGQYQQKDAIINDYVQQIEKYRQQEEALKLREIERFVTLENFNGETKLHKQKVEDWTRRAATMPVDDLVFYLQESYGRKAPYIQQPREKERRAGLPYEPTAVLSSDGKQPTAVQRSYSIYDSVGGL